MIIAFLWRNEIASVVPGGIINRGKTSERKAKIYFISMSFPVPKSKKVNCLFLGTIIYFQNFPFKWQCFPWSWHIRPWSSQIFLFINGPLQWLIIIAAFLYRQFFLLFIYFLASRYDVVSIYVLLKLVLSGL